MATALVRDLDDAVYERLKARRRATIVRWRPSYEKSWCWPRNRSMWRPHGRLPMRCVGDWRVALTATAERYSLRNAFGERPAQFGFRG